MIIIKLLFWNLAKNSIESYVIDLILENNIDIGVFAEYNGIIIESLLKGLQNRYQVYEGMGGCNKIIILAKLNYNVEVRREQNRYAIYSVTNENEQYIIAGIHLQDNSHSDSDVRKIAIRDLVQDLKEQEKLLQHNNTIVIGDFNASPFDDELIQKDSFNAVLFKELIMKAEFVTFEHKRYQRFYNPMLNYISEDDLTYGSMYYGTGLKTLYWYCYDQILVRKVLANKIIGVSFCKAIKNKRLLKDISPNKDISDHLPLIVEFERRINNG